MLIYVYPVNLPSSYLYSISLIDLLTSSRVEDRLGPLEFGHCLEKWRHRNLQTTAHS